MEETKKFTYEQLENIASQLHEQVRQLSAKLQEVEAFNIFKRLDYLFKVVENSKSFNKDFVDKCSKEIEDLITLPDTTSDIKENTNE